MKFHCFYVSVTPWRFCKITSNANNLSQHEMLKGTNVHEMTLWVTSGAPQFRTHFRFLTGCSEYAMIHTLSGTHVSQTILCVTFGARHRSIPLGLLVHTLGHLDPQGHPRTPERLRLATIWAGNVVQGCPPDLTSACPCLHPDLRSYIFP